MKTRDLALGLKHLGEDAVAEEAPVVAVTPDGKTYTVLRFEPEFHADGDRTTTVWLHIEEN